MVADTDPANLIPGLTISNTCYYPLASIDGLASAYCQGDPTVNLMGSAELGDMSGPANGMGEFFVNGVGPTTMFDLSVPGSYTISYVFDAADGDPDEHHPGCISTVTQDVTVGDRPDLSETHVDVTCPGGADGSIDLTVVCADPYDVEWSNGATTEDINGLSAGNYTVSVTTAICTSQLSVDILDGVDGEDPVISCPADMTIECDASTDPADTGMASATDNCDPNPVISSSDDTDLSDCGDYARHHPPDLDRNG
ncbi:MAG: SprB repeat-containing protein [Saprospiraceae bacterium]|nr:SprB repeat-containing protein [Saprospiraceae bacterium]